MNRGSKSRGQKVKVLPCVPSAHELSQLVSLISYASLAEELVKKQQVVGTKSWWRDLISEPGVSSEVK